MSWNNCVGQTFNVQESLSKSGYTKGEVLWVKWNQIKQNNRYLPKIYPLFWFWSKFWLLNRFQPSQSRNTISNFGVRPNRNWNQKLIFGFGSSCSKSNFVCSLKPPPFMCFLLKLYPNIYLFMTIVPCNLVIDTVCNVFTKSPML